VLDISKLAYYLLEADTVSISGFTILTTRDFGSYSLAARAFEQSEIDQILTHSEIFSP
jgi:hypothetical protein